MARVWPAGAVMPLSPTVTDCRASRARVVGPGCRRTASNSPPHPMPRSATLRLGGTMRLIDRDRELADLRRCFAASGRRVAIVSGVPGIGKSALLQALGSELRAEVAGPLVLIASGTPIGTGIAYGAL